MCGIAGILHLVSALEPVDESLLVRMRDRMTHRGPDAAGAWISQDRSVGLAHRRLSIVDLAADANQPMANEDGALQVVFNGEIYNHAAIRAELIQRGGHTWRTDHSDTEVILHAYEEWGLDCIHRFSGMFAFALWDERLRRLWLARDRTGIKPLYYTTHNRRFRFASEIKALLADPSVPRAVDHEAFFDTLTFLTTPAPRTLFRDICKLPPATWMTLAQDGTMQTRRYWDLLETPPGPPVRSTDEAGELLLEKLRASVQMRKMSDVPMGAFLSGGLDSSANVRLFAEGESRPVNTFCVGYSGDATSYVNENAQAREVADAIGAVHRERFLTEDQLLEEIRKLVYLQDEPIADPVCFPIHELSRLARDNQVTVCQVGEGADELLYGYEGWLRLARLERVASLPGGRAGMRAAAGSLRLAGHQDTVHHEWYWRMAQGWPGFWGGAEGWPHALKMRVLSPALRDERGHRSSWGRIEPIYRHFMERSRDTHPLQWMTYLDLQMRLPELLLMRVDRMSMGVGLEARVPFLDHSFIETVFHLPMHLKVFGHETKPLLRHALRGLLPPAVLRRPKRGFGVPVREWSSGRLGALHAEVVPRFCRESGLLDEQEALHLGQRHQGSRPWLVLNLALWWDQFIRRSPAPHALAT